MRQSLPACGRDVAALVFSTQFVICHSSFVIRLRPKGEAPPLRCASAVNQDCRRVR